MPKFSLQFQLSHDIEWFAKIGDNYIHAMSFGGLLPQPVNERNRNFILMRKAFQIEVQNKALTFNDYYIDRRLKRNKEQYTEEQYNIRRQRYLAHFEQMAARGFYSFDRDLDNEDIYHLIVKPQSDCSLEWFKERMPVFPTSVIKKEEETGDVFLNLYEYIGIAE